MVKTKEIPIPEHIQVFTDGSCIDNHKPGLQPGGWAALIITGKTEKLLEGGCPSTTNNRMELQAVIEALKHLKTMKTVQITITTDSTYVKNGVTVWMKNWIKNGWVRKNAGKKKQLANV